MTTVNQALELLLFTTEKVNVIVHGLGLHLELEDGYYTDIDTYEEVLDESDVTSITLHENGETTIQATYSGFGAEGL